MDKLQKFFKGLWRYKERIVFVVMLGFLGYRVYELFVPKNPELPPAVEVGEAARPEIPPNMAAPDAPEAYASLVRRSPFSYFSDAKTGEGDDETEQLGLGLLAIRQVGTKWRVKLRTPGVTRGKWYDEGEPFEEFVLEKINPEEKSVEVYSESIARTVTVTLR